MITHTGAWTDNSRDKEKYIFFIYFIFSCVTKHTERGHYGPAKRQQGCKMARNMHKKEGKKGKKKRKK